MTGHDGLISLAGYGLRRAAQARREPFCIFCGYNLTGLPDHYRCPECGRPYTWQMIEEYRADYAVKLREACLQGLTPLALRNYQDFLARIDEAISQQTLAVRNSEQNTAHGQENWKEQNKRLKAIDTLSLRHEVREKAIDNKQQQKIQEEHTARKYAARDEEEAD